MKRKRKFGGSVLFLIYLALLVWIILFKLQFNINDLDTVRKINIIPFYYDKEIGVDFHIKEVLENLLIFVPMGIYLQMLLFKSKSYLKLLIIAGISLLLEITQYILCLLYTSGLIGYRSYDTSVQWSFPLCLCSLIIIVAISVILVATMKEKENKKTRTKTKKVKPKKGWL